jgi:hypothetical protein
LFTAKKAILALQRLQADDVGDGELEFGLGVSRSGQRKAQCKSCQNGGSTKHEGLLNGARMVEEVSTRITGPALSRTHVTGV